jgi:hypothetical protein
VTDAEIAALFADLRAKREGIDRLIAGLEAFYGTGLVLEVPEPTRRKTRKTWPRKSARNKTRRTRSLGDVALTPPRIPRAASAVGVTTVVAARDEALLTALKRHGLMRRDKLAGYMPAEPNQTDEQREGAFRNALSRLKAKKLVGRTGDTYSLVGAGMERASNG